tara:strand:- start:120 stop:722 length:603 start_codon:yes stop_codon:yes gene_type:complete
MEKTVEFIFDVVSPTVYIAYRRLPEIIERTGATIIWSPVFLGGVMNASGNKPPGTVAAKGRYMNRDMERCAERYKIEFSLNKHFPVNTLSLQRIAVGLNNNDEHEEFLKFIDVCFKAIWVDGKNMGDTDISSDVLADAGFETGTLMNLANDSTIKEKLKSLTNNAVQRGVFGAPTFFVDREMYFGQDRLDYVEIALSRQQ